jgi:hypothetical protein
MLFIFIFFCIASLILAGCLAVAILNVVIRRESAYLLEERIKMVVDERAELMKDDAWPQSQVTVLPWSPSEQAWIGTDGFAVVVADHGHLEIRSFHWGRCEECPVTLAARLTLDDSFLKHLSKAVGFAGGGHWTCASWSLPRR